MSVKKLPGNVAPPRDVANYFPVDIIGHLSTQIPLLMDVFLHRSFRFTCLPL